MFLKLVLLKRKRKPCATLLRPSRPTMCATCYAFQPTPRNLPLCCPYCVIPNKHMLTPRLCIQDAMVCQVVQECVGLTSSQGNIHPALRHFAEWPLQILAACAPCKAAQLLHSCSLSHAEYVLVKVIYLILLSTALQLAGHIAELRLCMHTIASIQAKQSHLCSKAASKV